VIGRTIRFSSAVLAVGLAAGCAASPSATAAPSLRSTPYASQPAAGICSEVSGDEAVMRLEPGIPDPRCLIVAPSQHLRVVNHTGSEVQIGIGSYSAALGPGEEQVFQDPFGSYLLPGVHQLAVTPCCGGEIWLKPAP
jgi:hypothetical protein